MGEAEGHNNNPGQAVANGVRAPVSSQLREFNEDWSLAKAKDSLCMDSSEASSKPSSETAGSGGDQPVTMSEDQNEEVKASDERIIRNDLDLREEEEKNNFDDIKSRLRPRINQINYFKSNIVQSISQVSKIPNVDVTDGKTGSGKRKSSEQKQVAFLLPVNKQRRRNSEHYLKVSHQEEEGDMIRNQKYRRSRRKS